MSWPSRRKVIFNLLKNLEDEVPIMLFPIDSNPFLWECELIKNISNIWLRNVLHKLTQMFSHCSPRNSKTLWKDLQPKSNLIKINVKWRDVMCFYWFVKCKSLCFGTATKIIFIIFYIIFLTFAAPASPLHQTYAWEIQARTNLALFHSSSEDNLLCSSTGSLTKTKKWEKHYNKFQQNFTI